MQLKKSIRAVLAALITALLGAAGLVLAPGAHAVPGAEDALGNPNLNKTGSITVHKYENPAWGKEANGQLIADVPPTAKSMDGVEFILQKVTGVDLTKPEDWKKISQLQYNENTKKVTYNGEDVAVETNETKKTTADGGVAAFTGLKAGVYLVREGSTGTHKVIKKAQPFFVSIPFPSKVNNKAEWIYDIHAYPKNTVSDDGTKTLKDEAAKKVGDDVKWEIKYEVPALGVNAQGVQETYTKVGIEDLLDPHLKYVSAKVTLGTEVLTENTDYTVTLAPETKADDDVAERQKVTIQLSTARLATVQAGQEFKVELTTKITGLPEGGEIPNSFGPLVNDYNPGTETTTSDRPVKVGDLLVLKRDKDNQKPLKDAEFAVYETREDATAGQNAVATATSDANGEIRFVGLVLGNADQKTFYLKETKAPAGYVISTEVKDVNVKKGKSTAVEYTIDNTKHDGPNLPLTGAAGQLMLTLGGLALLGAAGGLTVAQVRRNRAVNA
ncbi:SpaH/EbpB family LPXTG-anchored major pilin [Actinotignum sanguinis]|uniref:SpaH/EbpB family LPXTG-anchored major pilin n=1 Tax=Actinotignum sanguinis TaxID=1445614 RepID=UPI00237EA8C9|nr:SpaH/EbpB family LPXTG-anchored major pilin [Actinotignum sanguinis]MDE1553803.1 SpaH/EbpB family LPXTG-anchored major pilin [Actinotignum sanguinis]MDE1565609.1 SpaH/EbpB family LPXTG-anchored major pilin [Actinotignum sanguinis]MDE1642683.1 SpaH/EbpB family LPXTG-anchored major pilin [Actinotignum sanguinis]MDK8287671.1 SpaH/EbpB family LPXTG-anchored major pilin [Actinotignum sanguinis]MDK8353625.1 SpaH/EbpB family LPXTG-anchored major pilin [Actinotignum sanguinis]